MRLGQGFGEGAGGEGAARRAARGTVGEGVARGARRVAPLVMVDSVLRGPHH